ncbi:unnamed protein product [Zymoseptoria tritici ST99CH_1A5]|uniref:Uncharacterized protein n=1 Tax=Zymoseptoria tritici ST99CH_1A5 TaxID=1276529 RepID=A0A1Y6LZ92_ZYMTR|nr:unnamed protein product [Zymoseptoria tritici ST99CH_3D1]SMY29723.1 unnamed protein product [Zymoseptoria tritici ST99CH_1A5]
MEPGKSSPQAEKSASMDKITTSPKLNNDQEVKDTSPDIAGQMEYAVKTVASAAEYEEVHEVLTRAPASSRRFPDGYICRCGRRIKYARFDDGKKELG